MSAFDTPPALTPRAAARWRVYRIVNRTNGLVADGEGRRSSRLAHQLWPIGSNADLQWSVTDA
jgi:hypothetical protein